MKTHINEERMLEVLDQGDTAWTSVEQSHLCKCPACTALLDQYKALYPQLSAMPVENLPSDFSFQVLARLPLIQPPKKESGHFVLWLGLGLMTIGLLVGLQAFYGLFSTLVTSMKSLLALFVTQMQTTKPILGIFSSDTVRLLLFIPVCFGFVGLLDRIIRRWHRPMLGG